MQKNERRAIRIFRLMNTMHKRQFAIDHPLLARQTKLRHTGTDRVGLLFVARRHKKSLAECLHRFVNSEPGRVCGKLKQSSARLADIERCEVFAIMHIHFAGVKL